MRSQHAAEAYDHIDDTEEDWYACHCDISPESSSYQRDHYAHYAPDPSIKAVPVPIHNLIITHESLIRQTFLSWERVVRVCAFEIQSIRAYALSEQLLFISICKTTALSFNGAPMNPAIID